MTGIWLLIDFDVDDLPHFGFASGQFLFELPLTGWPSSFLSRIRPSTTRSRFSSPPASRPPASSCPMRASRWAMVLPSFRCFDARISPKALDRADAFIDAPLPPAGALIHEVVRTGARRIPGDHRRLVFANVEPQAHSNHSFVHFVYLRREGLNI